MSRLTRSGAALACSAVVAGAAVAASPAAFAAVPESLTLYDSGGHVVVTTTGQHLIMFVTAKRFSTDGTSDAGSPGAVTVELMTKDRSESHSWTFSVHGGSFTNHRVRTGKQAKPYGKIRLRTHPNTSFTKHTCGPGSYTQTATMTTKGTVAFKTHNKHWGRVAKRHIRMTHGTLVGEHGPDAEEACARQVPCQAGTSWSTYHNHVSLVGSTLTGPKRPRPKSTIEANRLVRLAAPDGAFRVDDAKTKAPLPKAINKHGHPALRIRTAAGSIATGKALLVSSTKRPYSQACKTGTERGREYDTSWKGAITIHESAFGKLRVRNAPFANYFSVTIH
ncbi:MAG: hypothetical protein JO246_14270 [Frankiaceae bacterium]|nr:hypothetical protein [Frankiaceae bacterium]MBV9871566.1 hypothetical protein [Frankiaceae bacterium]